MPQKQSRSTEPRTWARRDRTIVPINKVRARSMRSEPTEAERKLWWHIASSVGVAEITFPSPSPARQLTLSILPSHSLKIVIELDGGQHAEQIRVATQSGRRFFGNRKLSCIAIFGTMTC